MKAGGGPRHTDGAPPFAVTARSTVIATIDPLGGSATIGGPGSTSAAVGTAEMPRSIRCADGESFVWRALARRPGSRTATEARLEEVGNCRSKNTAQQLQDRPCRRCRSNRHGDRWPRSSTTTPGGLHYGQCWFHSPAAAVTFDACQDFRTALSEGSTSRGAAASPSTGPRMGTSRPRRRLVLNCACPS